ncbi:telomere repeats-binding bouquet formation protein 1 [Grus japonensis]|uniref:Telomere repeats-binding bouquet formation protein 1 n=1 Tax=Grus japonensis TaxID=30415 RepID=A0ABC9XDK8_GRUJA
MENQKVQKKQCDVKTDLNLLLECLKYQMDCPVSQKEALITIYSICQQNSEASEYFREIGGLMFINDLAKSSVHCIVKEAALFALGIIMESNAAMGVVLTKYHTVSELLKLLSNDTLDTGEKISIILTIGHCTEVCEENQCELLQNNGLPLMIQVLTESQDEELNKAATFVLQNCKQMTEQLSLKINDTSLNMNNAEELDVEVRKRNLQDYWKKAKEILHRINLIEKEHDEEREQGRVFVDRSSEANIEASKYYEVNPADPNAYIERTHKVVHCPQLTSKLDDQVLAQSVNSFPLKNEIVNTMDPVNASTRQSKQKILLTPVKKDRLHTEISTFRSKKDSFQSILLTPFRKTKSNTSNRDEHSKNTRLTDDYNLIPTYEKSFKKTQNANLKRQKVEEMCNQECQCLKENRIYSRDKDENNEICSLDMNTRTLNKGRRTRNDFTTEEINYLLNGVKKMGNHWNLILWSYPFQKGRTSVDLSKKYYRLQLQVIII